MYLSGKKGLQKVSFHSLVESKSTFNPRKQCCLPPSVLQQATDAKCEHLYLCDRRLFYRPVASNEACVMTDTSGLFIEIYNQLFVKTGFGWHGCFKWAGVFTPSRTSYPRQAVVLEMCVSIASRWCSSRAAQKLRLGGGGGPHCLILVCLPETAFPLTEKCRKAFAPIQCRREVTRLTVFLRRNCDAAHRSWVSS